MLDVLLPPFLFQFSPLFLFSFHILASPLVFPLSLFRLPSFHLFLSSSLFPFFSFSLSSLHFFFTPFLFPFSLFLLPSFQFLFFPFLFPFSPFLLPSFQFLPSPFLFPFSLFFLPNFHFPFPAFLLRSHHLYLLALFPRVTVLFITLSFMYFLFPSYFTPLFFIAHAHQMPARLPLTFLLQEVFIKVFISFSFWDCRSYTIVTWVNMLLSFRCFCFECCPSSALLPIPAVEDLFFVTPVKNVTTNLGQTILN